MQEVHFQLNKILANVKCRSKIDFYKTGNSIYLKQHDFKMIVNLNSKFS